MSTSNVVELLGGRNSTLDPAGGIYSTPQTL